jgi:hypothetical protein
MKFGNLGHLFTHSSQYKMLLEVLNRDQGVNESIFWEIESKRIMHFHDP